LRIEGIPAPSAHIYAFLAKKKRPLDRMIALEVSSKLKKGRVLDVGTGPGFVPIEIAKTNPDLEVIGVDISREMIRIAKKNAQKERIHVEFKQMSAYDLKFEDEYFDLVISVGAIHHFNKPLDFFNEAFRVLKRNGELWIYDIVRNAEFKDVKVILSILKLPVFPSILAFKFHGLTREEWHNLVDISKTSNFKNYRLKDARSFMKLILKKT